MKSTLPITPVAAQFTSLRIQHAVFEGVVHAILSAYLPSARQTHQGNLKNNRRLPEGAALHQLVSVGCCSVLSSTDRYNGVEV